MIDFSQLGLNTSKPTNPRDIFMGLTQKNPKYQYPRDVQGEVWKQWYEHREDRDIIIKMNTGSGKTVVALMILQSCLNEGKGPALYVVPDKYLAEQVISQAQELGIKIVRSESELDYRRKKAILVTTIQKLVNGKSVFGLRPENNYDIESIVIDDMHACINSIQDQFSLTIPRNDELYNEFIKIFFDAMNQQSEGRFSEIIEDRNPFESLLVPYWYWQDYNNDIYQLLSQNQDKEFIKFKFDLIKDSLLLSHCYISSKEICIIPNCTPMHKIASFDDARRRIYLSATLADDSPFATVLGVDFKQNVHVITPEKANDIGERLIVVPRLINDKIVDEEIRRCIAAKAEDYNIAVLVPSFYQAGPWKELGGVVLSASNIDSGIEQIKSNKAGLYVFVNRYDGIDLADDMCRILVIDGLPNITNLNDRYEREVVRKSERIQREQIQRIEQGMGRGVRSISDFCFVVLLGDQLTTMLYSDDGYNYFSNATKAQFQLSERLCEQVVGGAPEDIIEIGDYLLRRDPQWMEVCRVSTASVEYDSTVNVSPMAIAIRNTFRYALIGDYNKATLTLNGLVNSISDRRVKGYYKQLLAEYTNLYDKNSSQQILKSAKYDNAEILNPIEGIQFEKIASDLPEQSRLILEYINSNELTPNKLIYHAEGIMDNLKFQQRSSRRFEAAVKDVFNMLGFVARQPEHEVGKGPDDFVILGSGVYLVIECKNETITDIINKHDCNQLNGSYNWFRNLYGDDFLSCTPIMIHHSNVFEYACSPDVDIKIMTPQLLDKFKSNILDLIRAIIQESNFKNIEKTNQLLEQYKLSRKYIVSEYTKPFKVKNL